jgi:hypothetical protein
MSLHNYISNKITLFLDNIYYNYLEKIYNDNINNIFNNNKIFVIKPEYFVYLQYYFIYSHLYNITHNNVILYSISLHMIYICELIFKNISIKYNYIQTNNVIFLIDTSHLLFLYLFSLKIFFLKIYFYYKLYILTNFMLFYLLMNINYIYTERYKCINSNIDFYHPFKFIILSPNKKYILNIINKTKFFTYSNFLLFINILLFIFY